MGKITIKHVQNNGVVQVDVPDGSLSSAVPLLREVLASCDKKKDLEVNVVEQETKRSENIMSQTGAIPGQQERKG